MRLLRVSLCVCGFDMNLTYSMLYVNILVEMITQNARFWLVESDLSTLSFCVDKHSSAHDLVRVSALNGRQ